jgi:hypothetical protein
MPFQTLLSPRCAPDSNSLICQSGARLYSHLLVTDTSFSVPKEIHHTKRVTPQSLKSGAHLFLIAFNHHLHFTSSSILTKDSRHQALWQVLQLMASRSRPGRSVVEKTKVRNKFLK